MILSVSRRTDIPCRFTPWFLNRLRAGYALVRNPLRPSQVSRVPLTPGAVECIVFWSKDPAPLLPHLGELEERGYPFYFQFTLTPYGRDLEPGLRDKEDIEAAFRALSRRVGRERVLWRYDPVVLTEGYPLSWHRATFEAMCARLAPYTASVTISFLDLYPRLRSLGLRAPEAGEVRELAAAFAASARRQGLDIRACAEPWDLTPYGIRPAACIDGALIARLTGREVTARPDRSQRPACGCLESVDIGAYDTCPNGCLYCYADHGRPPAPHDPEGELLTGALRPGDQVRDRVCRPALSGQTSLFSFGDR